MSSKEIIKSFLTISIIVLVIYLIFQLKTPILYIFISFIFSLILRPINDFFVERIKISKTFASIISTTLLILFFTAMILLFIPVLSEQGKNLSLLNTKDLKENFLLNLANINSYFESNGIVFLDLISESKIFSDFDFSFVTDLFNYIVSQIGSLSVGILSIVFITFFFLKDGQTIFKKITNNLPKNQKNKIQKSAVKIKYLLTRYFLGVFVQILTLFIFYSVLLFVVGVNNLLAIAFICAILNIIPYLGPLISIFLMLVLSFTTNLELFVVSDFINDSIYLILGFIIIQLIDNILLQPLIFSSSVKSHPLEIFLVIIFSGFLFGILGLIIAIPTYTFLKVIINNFIDFKKILSQ